jgi:hypothetical protein
MLATSAAAQDLFELEVFPFETTPAGHFDAEFHTNALSRGGIRPTVASEDHRPLHVSAEIAHGWTDRFEMALFVETTPFGRDGSAKFAGGHVRGQLRALDAPRMPFRIALAAEYAFNRPAFDRDLQTLEIRSILDRRGGRLSLILNPSMEVVVSGTDSRFVPTFDLSARAGWDLTRQVAINGEYFSRPGTLKHLEPDAAAHHLLFSTLDVGLGSNWEVSVGLGHCTTSSEPWMIKSIVGYRFGL